VKSTTPASGRLGDDWKIAYWIWNANHQPHRRVDPLFSNTL